MDILGQRLEQPGRVGLVEHITEIAHRAFQIAQRAGEITHGVEIDLAVQEHHALTFEEERGEGWSPVPKFRGERDDEHEEGE